MATLLEDLEAAANVLVLRHGNDIEKQLDSTIGARLREYARRLREEMERARRQFNLSNIPAGIELSVLTRINGPATPRRQP